MLPAFLFCDAVVCWVFFESLFLGSTLGGGENFPFFRLLVGPVCVWLALFDAASSIFGAGVGDAAVLVDTGVVLMFGAGVGDAASLVDPSTCGVFRKEMVFPGVCRWTDEGTPCARAASPVGSGICKAGSGGCALMYSLIVPVS